MVCINFNPWHCSDVVCFYIWVIFVLLFSFFTIKQCILALKSLLYYLKSLSKFKIKYLSQNTWILFLLVCLNYTFLVPMCVCCLLVIVVSEFCWSNEKWMSPFPLNLCLVKNKMRKGQNLNILSLEKHLDGLNVITLILCVLLRTKCANLKPPDRFW